MDFNVIRIGIVELPNFRVRRFIAAFLAPLFLMAISHCPRAQAADGAAIKAPDGFAVTLFADDDLAHDIHCLTIDSRGRITVAGLGYIKILTDTDADGVADQATLFAEPPPTGVQGMFWHGTPLGPSTCGDRQQDGLAVESPRCHPSQRG